MNKSDLVNRISNDAGITKAKANDVIDSFVRAIEETLAKGEKVTLVGFGTWETSTRQARQGRNPKTGEVINIPEKRVARFRPGTALNKQVNE